MRRDPLIIGGGPAGSAAAITLARAGYRPILIERAAGPTDKVCGDFLSTDTIQLAQSLGVSPAMLGGAPIDRVRLIHGRHIAEAALPFPALGLSRRCFDAALLDEARAAGAEVRTGQTVRHAVPLNDHWIAEIHGQAPVAAATIFLATGKHDLRDLPRPGVKQGAVGLKMYFALRPEPAGQLDRTIELTLFPGGYAGLQPVENGQAVLCIAVQRRAFQACGGNWFGLLAAISRRCPRFAWMLAEADALLPRPLAIAGIPYGHQAPSPALETLFRLGDQTAVIPSLTGDGMAIALHSGRFAATSWMAGRGAPAYHKALAQALAPQMRLAGALHHAFMSKPIQAAAMRAASLFPALLRQAAIRTRIPSGVVVAGE